MYNTNNREIFLTREGFKKLKEEIKYLGGEKEKKYKKTLAGL